MPLTIVLLGLKQARNNKGTANVLSLCYSRRAARQQINAKFARLVSVIEKIQRFFNTSFCMMPTVPEWLLATRLSKMETSFRQMRTRRTNVMTERPDERPNYLSYLVRLRRTQSGEGKVWRACLEEPLTQEVYRFDDLQSLLSFLLARTGQSGQANVNDQT